jgi:hypothetical protein
VQQFDGDLSTVRVLAEVDDALTTLPETPAKAVGAELLRVVRPERSGLRHERPSE